MRYIKCSPEAREKCPFYHHCDNDDMAWFEEGSPCDKFNKKLIPSPPPTNADHIRSMTDEELAGFIFGISDMTFENAEGWLKQPYGGDT